MSSAICFNLDQRKLLSPGNGLNKMNFMNLRLYDNLLNPLCQNMAQILNFGHCSQKFLRTELVRWDSLSEVITVFPSTAPHPLTLYIENIVRKGENAGS